MIARASANTRAIIIAVKILGALEGFLPKALMLAKLPAANTPHGPKIHRPKIIINAKFLLTILKHTSSLYYKSKSQIPSTKFVMLPISQARF
jgi:hypothetical protein